MTRDLKNISRQTITLLLIFLLAADWIIKLFSTVLVWFQVLGGALGPVYYVCGIALAVPQRWWVGLVK